MMPSQKRTRSSKAPVHFEDFETSANLKRSRIKKTQIKRNVSSEPNALLMLSLFSGEKKEVELTGREKAVLTRKTRVLMTGLGIDNMETRDYIPSTLDRTDLVAVKPVNLLQAFGGRGLFATQDIAQGTVIGIYTGEVFDSVPAFDAYKAEHPGADDSYSMTVAGRIVDAARKGNFTRYINFSDTQDNMEFIEGHIKGRKVVLVRAIKDIMAGQQFLVNYNTHEERNSKLYFFLNPSDGWLSAEELHQQHQDSYQPFTIHINLEELGVTEGDDYQLTQAGAAVINSESLSDIMDLNPADIDLPQLKLNLNGQVLDFNTADAFTPLQLACYLGQVDNVAFLLAQGANKDYHQNNSGQFPLSLALAGYAQSPGNENKYMTVLNLLVFHQANIFAHDRLDRTFVQQAISVLSDRHFAALLNTVKSRKDINELFAYVDENDHDVVLYSIKCKAFNKLGLLLELNPEYFEKTFDSGNTNDARAFESAVEGYTSQQKRALYSMLTRGGQSLPPSVMNELEVSNTRGFSYNR
ncbi:Dot/Icm T4SS effector AnkI/LegAS4 [Legionella shakespearei]|nr:Dot/Icm T4SS effector AnkI/LegAS4 [Legionella shakespearei]